MIIKSGSGGDFSPSAFITTRYHKHNFKSADHHSQTLEEFHFYDFFVSRICFAFKMKYVFSDNDDDFSCVKLAKTSNLIFDFKFPQLI